MLKKKITKILVGTNNTGKLREIKDLLPKNLKIYSTADFNIKSPPENGKTFKENSLIKARYFSKKAKMICLSDDSGLEIDILDGAPGIHSARWGGKKGDFIKAMNKVFKELDKKNRNWKTEKIKARFICALTIYGPNQKTINSIGKIEGHISPYMKGKNGFGYDPIFIPKGKKITFGEMKVSQKYRIDHRFKAFKKIKKFL
ncbi:RdgB/HAM1 family non-canonical purine NTP pyrophosphatase [Candidatus Pelagibacter sp. Uisw_099_02]|uniref:RdgB/HAM1 family non-canonical purine NTP pyrophosphatase n=1 Tax=Candidatus Pelagibacter sp. Uisw_099_02 TaxID=3230981 RepID=UPI00236D76C7|nr:RdgB/HAM1 family non-canonical purine NTP pyrophosphatase [Candidatus Pelagibacter sp.]|tara:strand:+ start:266 stop:868 length:603 start_codon:yes stop_codon:yes gene_type:complete